MKKELREIGCEIAPDDPIRKLFPHGWGLTIPEGIDLQDLFECEVEVGFGFWGFNNRLGRVNNYPFPELLPVYGEFRSNGAWLERMPAKRRHVWLINPPSIWLQDSQSRTLEEQLELGRAFQAGLPQGWKWVMPSFEEFAVVYFTYGRLKGEILDQGLVRESYVLGQMPTESFVRCENRYRPQGGKERRIAGGYIHTLVTGGLGFETCGDRESRKDIGVIAWAVREVE